MKMKSLATALVATAGMTLGSVAYAATGGGATIHNSATLTYGNNFTVSAQSNVLVKTVASALTIVTQSPVLPTTVEVAAGEVAELSYLLTSNSNGFDTYNMSISALPIDVAPGSSVIEPAPAIALHASITSRTSTAGSIYIPAGSGKDSSGTSGAALAAGAILEIDGKYYEVTTVTEGTPASTALSTGIVTPEVATKVDLVPSDLFGPMAPAIIAGTVPAGTQVGEVKEMIVKYTAGTPTSTTPGSYEITVNGSTAATDSNNAVVTFSNTPETLITVVSGEATLVKESRNISEDPNSTFEATGVAGKPGDVIEYKITASAAGSSHITGATLQETLSSYVNYVPNSTTVDGTPVADNTTAPFFPFANGKSIKSETAVNDGVIKPNEPVEVIFQVEVK